MTPQEAIEILIQKSSINEKQKQELIDAAEKMDEQGIKSLAKALEAMHNQEAEAVQEAMKNIDQLLETGADTQM